MKKLPGAGNAATLCAIPSDMHSCNTKDLFNYDLPITKCTHEYATGEQSATQSTLLASSPERIR